MVFPCTQCGECCRQVRSIYPDWPYIDAKTGYCAYLDGNRCRIYGTRPTECSVQKMAHKNNLPEKLYYILVANKCNEAIRTKGLDAKYLIKIEDIINASS